MLPFLTDPFAKLFSHEKYLDKTGAFFDMLYLYLKLVSQNKGQLIKIDSIEVKIIWYIFKINNTSRSPYRKGKFTHLNHSQHGTCPPNRTKADCQEDQKACKIFKSSHKLKFVYFQNSHTPNFHPKTPFGQPAKK